MNYLLDTHACIWAIGKQEKLSKKVTEILQHSKNEFWISKISLFEIAIKLKVNKLQEFKTPLPEFIQSIYSSGYNLLEVKNEHFQTYDKIEFPEFHRDPFDRYLIAAAQFEDLAIITKDEKFRFYLKQIEIVW